jgi:hypothetical protein
MSNLFVNNAKFLHAFTALRWDFLKITLVLLNQGKQYKIATQCGKCMRKLDL